ncbi:retrovirus-related Pol polyprotein from transposon 297 [Trichonephila clavipes]|nr:retrovirus-related Pol polyprotein from transposon 297 [Trichonephila clavipes]
MEEIVEKVSASPYVTVMDLSKGYFQIPLTPRAQRYAAFVTPFGTYIPKKMMFGLVCAPYYFCKLMAQVLEGLEQFALPYIDDIAIFSQGWKDHVKHIDIVLGRLRKAGLKVKPSKCKFAQEEVLFLGHRIGSGDTIASPLTDALKGKIKKEKITWDEKCGKAFEELKAKLVSQPILFAPDFATDFILQTDASEVGAGVVLSQRIEGEEHPIVFLSKKFSKAERNYSTVERELAAIIFGLKRLKHYLDGQKFIIETDHNPLRYLNKMGSTNPRTILDRFLGARAAGVHYRLFSVWTLVPVRLDQQLSDHTIVDQIASGAADCRLTYTMANCPQRRKREREKEGKRARKRQGLVVLGSGEENPRVLLGDADQESEARMSKNALRTGRRQAVERATSKRGHHTG